MLIHTSEFITCGWHLLQVSFQNWKGMGIWSCVHNSVGFDLWLQTQFFFVLNERSLLDGIVSREWSIFWWVPKAVNSTVTSFCFSLLWFFNSVFSSFLLFFLWFAVQLFCMTYLFSKLKDGCIVFFTSNTCLLFSIFSVHFTLMIGQQSMSSSSTQLYASRMGIYEPFHQINSWPNAFGSRLDTSISPITKVDDCVDNKVRILYIGSC